MVYREKGAKKNPVKHKNLAGLILRLNTFILSPEHVSKFQ